MICKHCGREYAEFSYPKHPGYFWQSPHGSANGYVSYREVDREMCPQCFDQRAEAKLEHKCGACGAEFLTSKERIAHEHRCIFQPQCYGVEEDDNGRDHDR